MCAHVPVGRLWTDARVFDRWSLEVCDHGGGLSGTAALSMCLRLQCRSGWVLGMGAGQPQGCGNSCSFYARRSEERLLSHTSGVKLLSGYNKAREAMHCSRCASHGIWWCSRCCPSDSCAPVAMTLSAQMVTSADPSDGSSLNDLLCIHTQATACPPCTAVSPGVCLFLCSCGNDIERTNGCLCWSVRWQLSQRSAPHTHSSVSVSTWHGCFTRRVFIYVLLRQWH